jgi:hypothetical protein
MDVKDKSLLHVPSSARSVGQANRQRFPDLLFEDLFVAGCEALFVVWVGKVYLTLSYDQAVSSGLHDFG